MSGVSLLSPRFHYTFGPHEPAVTLRSGQSIELICPDSDNRLSNDRVLSDEQRYPPDAPPWSHGNPVAGPIAIEGAQPGDQLAVTIDRIVLDRADGQTLIARDHGLVPALLLEPPDGRDTMPRRLYRWRLDHDRGIAQLENPIGDRAVSIPIRPFVGCIGVCPAQGQSLHTLYSGAHGGNMDLPLIAAGTTVHFPVFYPGGLLMLGDLHAAQGHGEIIGGGIETSGRVRCTVRLVKDQPLDAIRFDTPYLIAATGHDGDLRAATQQAYAHLLSFVIDRTGLNRWDAYHLISQTGSLMVGGLLTPPFTVAACIEHRALHAQGVA